MTKQEQLIDWLKDAHTMEKQIIEVLESHAADAKEYPEAKAAIEDHLEQTKTQADRLEARLKALDSDTSGAKDVMGMIMGKVSGVATEMHADKVIKNSIAEYTTEHFEIACYTSLKAAAEEIGDQETAELAEQICEEEQRMAELLCDSLPKLTQMYLSKQD